MPTTWYDAKVINIQPVSPNTRRFWVEIPELEAFQFKAGQFVTMDLPIGEKRLQRWRSYSIASAPSESNQLEFCIVRLDGGKATEYLFDHITVGSTLRFKGPDGAFVLPEAIDHDMVMVCTGTGIAPFRSMLQHIAQENIPHRKLHLIFGTRQVEGILYQSEFLELQKQLPNFHYSVALSREPNLDPANYPFDIQSGYVHSFYLNAYATPRSDVKFYLCGWQNMVDEAVLNLTEKLGYDKRHIITELYG
jgi:ferredoxin-NADP reductase